MSRNKIFKSVGFIGSLVGAAALVGSAAVGTGAYFSDSKDGSLQASSGHLTLNTTDRNLVFADLQPGEDKTRNIDYNIDSGGNADVWLVFNGDDLGYKKFSGAKNDPAWVGGGLGRYAHIAIANDNTSLFESWNLATRQATGPESTYPVCDVNSAGHGQGVPATSVADTPPLCAVPLAVKIASNLVSGQGGTLKVTFGLTGRATGQNGAVANVPFKVVATQAGVLPTAANF